jgi:hypothetical protein
MTAWELEMRRIKMAMEACQECICRTNNLTFHSGILEGVIVYLYIYEDLVETSEGVFKSTKGGTHVR